jgi:hypothetical protein
MVANGGLIQMAGAFDRRSAAHEMLIQQHRRCFETMLLLQKQWVDTDRLGIAAIAVFYAWQGAATMPLISHAKWVPVIISLVVLRRVNRFLTYARGYLMEIRQIEQQYLDPASAPPSIVNQWLRKITPIEIRKRPWYQRLGAWYQGLGISRAWCLVLLVTFCVAALSEPVLRQAGSELLRWLGFSIST